MITTARTDFANIYCIRRSSCQSHDPSVAPSSQHPLKDLCCFLFDLDPVRRRNLSSFFLPSFKAGLKRSHFRISAGVCRQCMACACACAASELIRYDRQYDVLATRALDLLSSETSDEASLQRTVHWIAHKTKRNKTKHGDGRRTMDVPTGLCHGRRKEVIH